MKITHHIPASLILGSLLLASPPVRAGEVGVGSVRLIQLPVEGDAFGSIVYSDDGSTMAVVDDITDETSVQLYEGVAWRTVYKEFMPLYALYVTDMSSDGSALVFTDFMSSFVYQDGVISNLPKIWANDNGVQFAQLFQSTAISDDGESVAIIGRDASIEYDDDRPLLWQGGTQLSEIEIGDPENDEFGYRVIDMSADGQSVLITAAPQGQINNLRDSRVDETYVWTQGGITQIPAPPSQYELIVDGTAISTDGAFVVGTASAPVRAGDEFDAWYETTSAENLTWIWDRATNTTRQVTGNEFEHARLNDLSDDGSIVLGNGVNTSGQSGGFLWIDGRGIIFTDDLFRTLGIDLDVDGYAFQNISNDGTVLKGIAYRDGQVYALIVTIPDLTP